MSSMWINSEWNVVKKDNSMNKLETNALRIAELKGAIEEWSDISGYEGLYKISSFGRIKSLDKRIKCRSGKYRLIKGKILKPALSGYGGKYYSLTLYNNGIHSAKLIHRLVAENFLPKPSPSQNEVNHIDGDKLNNHFTNLEWCTHSENITHSYRVLKNIPTMLGRKGKLNALSMPIKVTNLATGEEKIFESQHEAANHIGVRQYNISRYLSGKRRSKKYKISKYLEIKNEK